MRKRELLLGFGAGMIVAGAITGWFQAKQVPSSTRALSSDQIKNAAKELQMVVLTKEEYEQWQQEKKVNVKPAPAPPKAPTKPQAPLSKQTITPQVPAAETKETTEQTSTQQNAATVTPTPAQNPAPPSVEIPQIEKQVSFTVPYKATAEGVAKQLVQAGILPTDNKFVDELRNQDKLNRIRVGTYQISTPATEAQIVKLITTPPKK
ncbi:DNA polymerase III subunit gamma/tau [Brevibacillus choshinensis]|uniref:DNA polymerase III subunit gamma/tau n=1 Tax=Brevibacillus choshinensis TaxID=54911 RepID=UPI002E233D7C|nr:DNA polymerase III subunit gamma/tau [Brevibacillus choshinensis]